MRFACAALSLLLVHTLGAAPKPHIVYILIDDWGWSNWGTHRVNDSLPEIQTPNLDALAADGVLLDRFYTHKFCGPSRAALQSGRLPIHVTVVDSNLADTNPRDPVGGFQGIPRNMTGIANVLGRAGYATHMAGVGVAVPRVGSHSSLLCPSTRRSGTVALRLTTTALTAGATQRAGCGLHTVRMRTLT